MLCMFRLTPYSKLDINMARNPWICDCLDFEVYSFELAFPVSTILNDLYCDRPLGHRRALVNTRFFPRLMNGDKKCMLCSSSTETAIYI
jgi:hypothetical protein